MIACRSHPINTHSRKFINILDSTRSEHLRPTPLKCLPQELLPYFIDVIFEVIAVLAYLVGVVVMEIFGVANIAAAILMPIKEHTFKTTSNIHTYIHTYIHTIYIYCIAYIYIYIMGEGWITRTKSVKDFCERNVLSFGWFNLFGFFFLWQINLRGLVNARAILVEGQWLYHHIYSWWNKGVHAFPWGINLKVNVIPWLEFELAYSNIAFQNVSYKTTGTDLM